MPKMIAWTRVLLLLAWFACPPACAQDGPAPPTRTPEFEGLAPEDARRLLAMLADETRRARLMESLREIAAAPSGPSQPLNPSQEPSPGQPSSPSRPSGQPAAPPQPALPRAPPQPHAVQGATPHVAAELPEKPGPSVRLERDSLGAQLLARLSGWLQDVVSAIDQGFQTAARYWQARQQMLDAIENPATLDRLRELFWRLVVVLAFSLTAEWLSLMILRRPRAALARYARTLVDSVSEATGGGADLEGGAPKREQLRALAHALARLPLALARLFLDLIPVFVFAAVANLLAGTALGDAGINRLAILVVANAYALCRATMCAVRAGVGSGRTGPSVLMVAAGTAAYVETWARSMVAVAVFGIAAADAALLLGLDAGAYDALVSIVALVDHVLLAIVIVQCRRPIAAVIRGPVGRHGVFARLRLGFANIWHLVAIFLDLALWAVWFFKLPNGYVFLLRLCLASAAVLILARLAAIAVLGGLDRLLSPPFGMFDGVPGLRARAMRYRAVLRQVLSGVISAVAVVMLLETWGVDAFAWFGGGGTGARLLFALLTIGVAIAVAAVVWEGCNVAIELHLARLTQSEQYPRVARLRTLVPVLRAALLSLIVVGIGLTALAEIGVNIMPLLASAGVVGIAVGLGSQKLMQDVITGLFLMVENSMRVGEWVSAGGVSGTVEQLTVRTVQLRGGDGTLHIIPYSSVSTVSNTNRGTGNAAVSISVACRQDTDRIGEVLKEIAVGMRKEPRFAGMMRGDLDLWGVDKVESAAVTITGQIACTDSGRWPVQREFNRRMKMRFEELGIEFAIPTQRIMLRKQSGEGADFAPDRPAPRV